MQISKSYNASEWREDLKRITRHAGAEGKPAVFMFSDSQIKQESFVEDINNLLNSGEVPNMFPYDERAAVLEQCRQLSKKEGLSLDTAVELWNFFVDKTRANLHIVLCFSPIGDAFRNRLRQFPSLVNCCTIDWFSAWPNDALEAVALKFLNDVDVSSKQRGHIMSMCKMFHEDGIISDLFPGVVLPKADYAAMEAAMRDACAKRNLQPTEYFLLKSIQLYEMIVVRHGLMIVGLPFSGKTASYQVLADALTLMEERGQEGQSKAEYHVINPKSITMGQLYGQ
ncbi:uncharacterized protein HaLaN_02585, partial [Haematococcus lacustris]